MKTQRASAEYCERIGAYAVGIIWDADGDGGRKYWTFEPMPRRRALERAGWPQAWGSTPGHYYQDIPSVRVYRRRVVIVQRIGRDV